MWLDLGQLLLGGLFLYFGAEWLVGGAAGLARIAGVRPLVIGLTVVSWGTSAPELVVSALAAIEGSPAIALGNVVGSNIANLGLILGLTALIAPPRVEGGMIRREIPVLVLTALAIPLFLINDEISRLEGIILMLAAAGFTVWLVRGGDGGGAALTEEDVAPGAPHPKSLLKMVALAVLGLAVLVAGGRLFVLGATGIALEIGMSERIVGLTVVAIGTSLPELATSLIAAFRGHSDIAVGNVVGSNIFNVLIVLGAASAIHPLEAELGGMVLDIGVMIGMTLIGAVMIRSARLLTRAEGAVLTVGYGAFLGALVAFS